jgi:ABC-2 type transport system permease protein
VNRLQTVVAFFKLKTKETFTYRGSVLLWITGWLLSFMTAVFLWRSASFKNITEGFTLNQIITYYFLGLFVWATCWWCAFYYVNSLIKDGDLLNFILKPFNFHWFIFAGELAWHVVNILIFITLFVFIFLIIKDFLIINLSLVTILLFIASLGLGCLVVLEFNLVFGMFAFWVTDADGLGDLMWLAMNLLGGQVAPLAFFPNFLQRVLKLLPFRFMYSFPLEIYLQLLNPYEVITSFMVGLFWVFCFHFTFRFLWQKGLKVYVGRSR